MLKILISELLSSPGLHHFEEAQGLAATHRSMQQCPRDVRSSAAAFTVLLMLWRPSKYLSQPNSGFASANRMWVAITILMVSICLGALCPECQETVILYLA